jgi:O-antigen/teichoic acid export membrane protein
MGSFNIAYNLAIVPSQKIKNVLTTVLTSGFAKIQLDPISFAKNNQKALLYISLLFIPLMFILSGVSENLIVFIYGLKWIDAGQLLLFLAFVGMMKGIAHLLRSAILAKGMANVVFVSTILEIVASLPIMYFFVQDYGIYGLMIGYMLGAAVSGFYTIYYYDQLFGENRFFYKTVSIPFLIGTLIFCCLLSIHFLDLHFFIELFIQGVVAVLMLILLIKLFYKSIFNEVLVKLKLKKVNV